MNVSSKIFAVSVSVAAVCACTPSVEMTGQHSPQLEYATDQEPALGRRAHATVGEVVYMEENRLTQTGVRLDQPVNESFGLGARVVLETGAVLIPAQTQDESAYCSQRPAYIEPLQSSPTRSVCFFDDNGDSRLDRFWIIGTLASTDRTMSETPISKRTEILGKDGFRKELVFQGINNNVIRLLYREYSDTLIRPAFSQELTYTFDALPAEIKFRNVDITIHKINSSSIEYTVARGFEA